ncbi:beta-Ala-His dipeptidase [Feifania hominis]|uniref:Cytosol non-specific dipeptidase n=1 Tax=Feifania hominis TaxID=2763660 RepID=A0A926DE94_9FIRM|nr:beta-Ala-His dipeptidase [Feifania hominis]MBC8536242.1 beta-Ala-His dipeptidase [Feifania hominis]
MPVLDQSIPCFRYFEELCAIPHGSHNEKALSDWLVAFARERGLWVRQEECGNVIIKKDASPGYESAAPVMLQGHMDMVCEKTPETVHDFTKDPLDLYLEDGWLKARGTTLGADDGCGVATMLAILDDNSLCHPKLECVFTVAEETGMFGAKALDASDLEARRMIGLDACGENVTVTTSAGGLRAKITKALTRAPFEGTALSVAVRGLLGGHSGVYISAGRGNAIKLLARLLHEVELSGTDMRLVSISGGSKDNAIPRDADAVIVCSDAAAAEQALARMGELIAHELRYTDAQFSVSTGSAEAPSTPFDEASSRELVTLLRLLPDGVAVMSHAVEGLVQTSDNVGVLSMDGDTAVVEVSMRSAGDSELDELAQRIGLISSLCGAQCQFDSRYPGMEYQSDSPFRDKYAAVMKEVWGVEPKLLAVHAGGEGGYFAQKLPGIEMIAVGPFIEDVHSPLERMDMASFKKCYDFICALLERLSE